VWQLNVEILLFTVWDAADQYVLSFTVRVDVVYKNDLLDLRVCVSVSVSVSVSVRVCVCV
jgi:hypothetical protein